KDPVAFAVDIAPDRSYSAICAYGVREDGIGHLEVIDHLPGVDWVMPRLIDLKTRFNPVAIALDAIGPASSLLIDLQQAGTLPPEDRETPKVGDLAVPTSREVAGACGALVDAVRQEQLRHIDQPVLSHAVAGVKTRPLGDAWAWGRRASGIDI